MTLLTAMPPWLPVFAAAAVVALVGRHTGRGGGRRAGHVFAAVTAAGVAGWLYVVPAGAHLGTRLFGFEVVLFAVDPFSRAVGLVLAVAAVANVAYAHGTGASTRATATALCYVGASLGAVFAGDWLTLVVWWELMAVTATALVWQSPEAVRAGYRYAVYHQLGGATLVAGVLLHYARVGTFLFGDGLATGLPGAGLAAGLPTTLALLGVGMNVGFLGLHVWVVDAYPRPHVATTVFLSGFTTKVGVYTLVRVDPDGRLVATMGAAMVLVGVTMAVLQTDVRRLLSYHIVSQVGYMVVGIGLATAAGRAAGIAHLVNNVLYKTFLFMVAGVVILATGRESLKKVGGLGRELPVTAVAFVVAALSITGIPGFAGFVSKGFVTSATDAAGGDALYWALQVGAVGTVVSFVKFGYYAFLRDAPDGQSVADGTVGPAVAVAFAVLAVPCVVFGLAPGVFAAILPPGVSTAGVFSVSKLTDAVVITAVGTVAFAAIRRPLARVTAVPDLEALYHPAGRRLLDATNRTSARVGETLDRTGHRLLVAAYATAVDPDTFDDLALTRPTIGSAVLLLVVVAALGLVVVLTG